MITVMGATGNTGSKIARTLLQAGEQLRALGRSENKLAELARAGAEPLRGDTLDANFLTRAFNGADAVYTLLATDRQAPDYAARQQQEGEAIARAIQASGVRHVVALSSVGADVSEGTGVIVGLHAQEERLKRVDGVNVLFLRAVSFFENFYEALGLIEQQGIMADSVTADLAIPMVGTRDIASAAVKALRNRSWQGHIVHELLGPRDLTHIEIARIIGARIGKPDLPYIELSYADMAQALVQAGLSESFAALYVEMTRAFNEQRVQPLHGRTSENTTPTRFEDFAGELASAYQAG